jgi:hypothetical protein
MFCQQIEIADHLFFQCSTTKVVWGIVAVCFGTTNIPTSTQHYRHWIYTVFPEGEAFHHFGFVAVCWAIWKYKNKAILTKNLIKHPVEIMLHTCALLSYWTGLFTPEVQEEVVAGINTMLAIAHGLLLSRAGAGLLEAYQRCKGIRSTKKTNPEKKEQKL